MACSSQLKMDPRPVGVTESQSHASGGTWIVGGRGAQKVAGRRPVAITIRIATPAA
jgi:hypothetical protein